MRALASRRGPVRTEVRQLEVWLSVTSSVENEGRECRSRQMRRRYEPVMTCPQLVAPYTSPPPALLC